MESTYKKKMYDTDLMPDQLVKFNSVIKHCPEAL